jgi:hypothetical protein
VDEPPWVTLEKLGFSAATMTGVGQTLLWHLLYTSTPCDSHYKNHWVSLLQQDRSIFTIVGQNCTTASLCLIGGVSMVSANFGEDVFFVCRCHFIVDNRI